MSASTAMVLEGLRELAQDPEALAEVRPTLRLILGIDEQASSSQLQSVVAAAARLAVHHRTVERMARAGRLPGAVKVGTKWRIPVDAMPVSSPAQETGPLAQNPRRSRGSAPKSVQDSSAESAIRGPQTGRVVNTTPRSDPRSVRAPGGLAQRTGDPMYEKNGSAPAGASVTPIKRGVTK